MLPVELDRSRPIYCDDCITIVREERKGNKGGKGKSSGSLSKKSDKPREEKKPVQKPPRPSEGKVVEKLPDEPSISLEALEKPKKTSTEPSLDLGALLESEPKKSNTPPATNKPYTCSECGTSFTASVKLDRSRDMYCEDCLQKRREKKREEKAATGGSTEEASNKKKRKRRRKKKTDQDSTNPSSGSLKTGQTIRFD